MYVNGIQIIKFINHKSSPADLQYFSSIFSLFASIYISNYPYIHGDIFQNMCSPRVYHPHIVRVTFYGGFREPTHIPVQSRPANWHREIRSTGSPYRKKKKNPIYFFPSADNVQRKQKKTNTAQCVVDPFSSADFFPFLVHRETRVCTAACCRDDLSENSSPHTSSQSSRISHRVQIDFAEEEIDTNGSSLDFYEAKVRFFAFLRVPINHMGTDHAIYKLKKNVCQKLESSRECLSSI